MTVEAKRDRISHCDVHRRNPNDRFAGRPALLPWTRGLTGTIIIVEARAGTTMDVGEWLRGLGFGQYEALFRDNDIDAEVLSELTESDLNQLGVSFGHRKRLLKAIASLATAETVAEGASPASTSSSTDAAERRQLTVMFCDLVGAITGCGAVFSKTGEAFDVMAARRAVEATPA